jgi:hypothetical protein
MPIQNERKNIKSVRVENQDSSSSNSGEMIRNGGNEDSNSEYT